MGDVNDKWKIAQTRSGTILYQEAVSTFLVDAFGFIQETTLVSVSRLGTGSGNGFSFASVLSTDGQVVASFSEASDLVATATTGQRNVFMHPAP